MKKINLLLISISLLISVFLSGCSGNKTVKKVESSETQNVILAETQEVKNPVVVGKETSLLLKDLVDNGDYVNTKDFPSLIKASIVKESLDRNIPVSYTHLRAHETRHDLV